MAPANPSVPPDDEEIPVVGPPELPRPAFVNDRRPAPRWVRGVLIVVAGMFLAIFALAAWLRPYDEDGQPRSMATHTQLGLPPCNFVVLAGKPCPSCGMTTAFSLLMHGDPVNSLRANWVGTLLALYWLALIPWAIVSAARGRLLIVRSGEWLMTASVVVFLVLMLGRWAVLLLTPA